MITKQHVTYALFAATAFFATDAHAVYIATLASQNPTEYWRMTNTSAGVNPPTNNSSPSGGTTLGSSSGANLLRPSEFIGFESTNTWADYDGGNSAVLTLPLNLIDSDEGSVSYWLRPTASGDGTQLNLWARNTTGSLNLSGASKYVSTFNRTDGDLGMKIESTSIEAASSLAIGEWNLVVATWDRNTGAADGVMRLYLNGSEVASNTTASWTSFAIDGNMRFGKESANSRRFNGSSDELAVWTRELSAGEVADQYNAAFTGLPEPSTFVLAALGLVGLVAGRRRRR